MVQCINGGSSHNLLTQSNNMIPLNVTYKYGTRTMNNMAVFFSLSCNY